jgi:hypothetical protein
MTRSISMIATALVLASAAGAGAQDIGARVRQIGNGTVRLTFASKPGVCGDGESFVSMSDWYASDGGRTIFRNNNGGFSITHGNRDWSDWRRCEEGPLRVALEVDNGQVIDVRTFVGKNWPAGEPVMIVSSKNAVSYLLQIVENGTSRAGKRAITPIIMADSVDPWRDLLRIAKNGNVSRDTRKSAIFWVGQAAADEATKHLKDMVSDPGDIEVRKSAIFALSQQRTTDAVTALIEVVKKNPEKELKKSALFWLSQIDDPRVYAMFEDILLKK